MLKRVFRTREQALDVYRTQLSKRLIFVETFEAERLGRELKLKLEIVETRQSIVLDATVSALVGKREAVERAYGQRAGLLLEIALSPEIIEPLRRFFLAEAAPARPRRTTSMGEAAVVAPFLSDCMSSAEAANAEVDRFLALTETGNLCALFGLSQTAERSQLRRVYNQIVRALHPDVRVMVFDAELNEKLELAYQILNEVYSLLQHPIERAVYFEVSKLEHSQRGLSYKHYKAWQSEYRQKNSANIRMSNTLLERCLEARALGDHAQAEHDLNLSLQYDPFNVSARALQS